jgi:integrase
MKGHIRKRGKNSWAIVIDATGPDNRRRRKWISVKGTKKEAQVRCAQLITEMQGGSIFEPAKATLDEYLQRWLDHMAGQVSPQSHATYAVVVNAYLTPLLGHLKLTKLQPTEIAKGYAIALQQGRRNGAGLSATTVRLAHRTLHQALKQAVAWKIIGSNPCAIVKPPRVERRIMETHDLPTTVRLIEGVRETELHMPVLLAVTLGLRRGELIALRWRDLDCATAVLSVRASIEQATSREKVPKNGDGRTVAVPDTVLQKLRRHRLKQAEQLLAFGIRQSEITASACAPAAWSLGRCGTSPLCSPK